MLRATIERIKKFTQEYVINELRQAGVYEITQPAEGRLQQLLSEIEKQTPQIELLYDQTPTNEEWAAIIQYCNFQKTPEYLPEIAQKVSFNFGEYIWKAIPIAQASLYRLENLFPVMRIVWQKNEELSTKDVQIFLENTPFLVWIHHKSLKEKWLRLAQKTLPQNKNFISIVQEYLSKAPPLTNHFQEQHKQLNNYIAFQALQKFNHWTQEQIQKLLEKYELNKIQIKQEERFLQARKQQLSHSSNLLGSLKKIADQHFNIFKEQFHTSLNQFFASNPKHKNAYFQRMEDELNLLSALQVTEERVKSKALKIPPKFQQNFIEALKSAIRQEFAQNAQQLNDTLNQVTQEVKTLCKENNNKEPNFSINYLLGYEYENIIDNLSIDKDFEVEIPKKNLMEIIMGARRYVFLLMIIMSTLVVPFLGKDVSTEIKISIAVLGIALTVFGFFDTKRTSKKEEEEKKVQALKKAKEHLKGFAKNFMMEVRKEWTSVVMKYLEREIREIFQHTEATLKSSNQEVVAQDDYQKQQIKERLNRIKIQEAKVRNLKNNLSNRLQKTLEIGKNMQS